MSAELPPLICPKCETVAGLDKPCACGKAEEKMTIVGISSAEECCASLNAHIVMLKSGPCLLSNNFLFIPESSDGRPFHVYKPVIGGTPGGISGVDVDLVFK
jgi:hypothetical protein